MKENKCPGCELHICSQCNDPIVILNSVLVHERCEQVMRCKLKLLGTEVQKKKFVKLQLPARQLNQKKERK